MEYAFCVPCMILLYTFNILLGGKGDGSSSIQEKMKNGIVKRKRLGVPVPSNFSSDCSCNCSYILKFKTYKSQKMGV